MMYSFFMMGVMNLGMLLGSGGLPISLPPQPLDAKLMQTAGTEPMVWVYSAGAAEADFDSKNQTEQLLAEPQVRMLLEVIEDEVMRAIAEEGGDSNEEKLISDVVRQCIGLTLRQPTVAMLHDFKFDDRGRPADMNGVLMIKAGDDVEKLQQAVAKIEQMMSNDGVPFEKYKVGKAELRAAQEDDDDPFVVWGFAGDYAILGVGKASAKKAVDALAAANADTPDWLAAMKKVKTVVRPATFVHVDAAAVRETFEPVTKNSPEMTMMLAMVGLDSLASLNTVSGLDADGFASRTTMDFVEAPGGVLAMLDEAELSKADLADVPRDATFYSVMKIDADAAYASTMGALKATNPRAHEQVTMMLAQFEKQAGINLKKQVIGSLGDRVSVYNSPGDGGIGFTGLTIVAPLEDAKTFSAAFNAMLAITIRQELANQPPNRWRRQELREFKYRGQRIEYLNQIGRAELPFAPAWCITDDAFVFSLYPQMISAYLDRASIGEKRIALSIAQDKQAAAAVTGDAVPAQLTVVDTPAMFKKGYPLLHMAAVFMAAELQREGVGIDMALLPSARAIQPHLQPERTRVYRTEKQIVIESESTLPLMNGAPTMLMPMMFLGFNTRMLMQAPARPGIRVAPPAAAPAIQLVPEAVEEPFGFAHPTGRAAVLLAAAATAQVDADADADAVAPADTSLKTDLKLPDPGTLPPDTRTAPPEKDLPLWRDLPPGRYAPPPLIRRPSLQELGRPPIAPQILPYKRFLTQRPPLVYPEPVPDHQVQPPRVPAPVLAEEYVDALPGRDWLRYDPTRFEGPN